jgi:hypothetical protein
VDANAVKKDDQLIVFPVPDKKVGSLTAGCDYGRCVAKVTDVLTPVSGAQTIRYTSTESLAGLSPGSRVYFANQQVRYCVEGNTLTRATAPIGASVIMQFRPPLAASIPLRGRVAGAVRARKRGRKPQTRRLRRPGATQTTNQ